MLINFQFQTPSFGTEKDLATYGLFRLLRIFVPQLCESFQCNQFEVCPIMVVC